jgi:hypothetical protein
MFRCLGVFEGLLAVRLATARLSPNGCNLGRRLDMDGYFCSGKKVAGFHSID